MFKEIRATDADWFLWSQGTTKARGVKFGTHLVAEVEHLTGIQLDNRRKSFVPVQLAVWHAVNLAVTRWQYVAAYIYEVCVCSLTIERAYGVCVLTDSNDTDCEVQRGVDIMRLLQWVFNRFNSYMYKYFELQKVTCAKLNKTKCPSLFVAIINRLTLWSISTSLGTLIHCQRG